jgi:hypothetical protein
MDTEEGTKEVELDEWDDESESSAESDELEDW